jgi:hypothetical protein
MIVSCWLIAMDLVTNNKCKSSVTTKMEVWTMPVNQRTIKGERDFLPLIQIP